MLMATCCEDDVVPHVLPFVQENIKSPDWKCRDAAVMAFGKLASQIRLDINVWSRCGSLFISYVISDLCGIWHSLMKLCGECAGSFLTCEAERWYIGCVVCLRVRSWYLTYEAVWWVCGFDPCMWHMKLCGDILAVCWVCGFDPDIWHMKLCGEFAGSILVCDIWSCVVIY